MNVVENIIINSNTEEEFRACEELEALYRSNKAAAGALSKKAEPKAGGLHRKAPLKAKTGLQRKTPLQAHAVAPAGQGGEFDAERQTSRTGLQSKPLAPRSIARPEDAQAGEFQPEAETSRDAGSKWNGLQRKTPLKAKSPMKATPSKRHYGHLVKNGWCACCGKGTLETEWHHIIYRSHGGDEADENMLEVCRDCHAKIHAGEIGKDEVAFARLTAGSYLEENQRVIGAKA